MKTILKSIFYLVVIISLSSSACNCHYGASGYIYDKASGEILDSVAISGIFWEEGNSYEEEYISQSGFYAVKSIGWPCLQVKITFQKAGYETMVDHVPKGAQLDGKDIYLKQLP